MPVLAAHNWKTNADLIEDCAALGYLRQEWLTLDPTYHNGTWWKKWRPTTLVALNRQRDGSDFRHLPFSSGLFKAIAYDPPYVAKGGRSTSGIKEMDERYGKVDCPPTPQLLQELINDGLTEMYRLVAKGGYVLTKSQDYVSSGKLWIGTHHTMTHGLELGFAVQDRFEHIGRTRPQPPRTRKDGQPVLQQHARRNLSTLIVFKK
ncbi:MAG: hypothetical protein NVS9B15_04700 [Acidobacteriaceae bacterium]